jgi:hypothetical protein
MIHSIEVDMGIDIVVTPGLFEPLPKDARWFSLKQATTRALELQPEATLSHGIDRVSITVFNRNQVTRLLQEFRYLAQQSDDVTRQNLEDAASFIEEETSAIGPGPDCYVSFVGD